MAMQQFRQSLPMLLYQALDAVMPRFRLIFKDFGLTEQQWRVLRVLWESDGMPFKSLAETTLIPAPSLVGVVDRLSDSGLVSRQRSEDDRRQVFVHLSEAGRALEEKVMPLVQQTYFDLRTSVNDEVWQQLVDGLKTINSLEGKTS